MSSFMIRTWLSDVFKGTLSKEEYPTDGDLLLADSEITSVLLNNTIKAT